MHISRRLLAASLLTWLGGCSNSSPTLPAPLSQPLPESFVVSGTLFETVNGVSRPLAGRQVRLLSISAKSEIEEAFFTDDNGRYTANVPPGTRVFAYGRDVSGPWQPCLASAVVDMATNIDVQLAPAGSSLTPPPAANPMITGFVYQTTSQGRKPLPGVVVWLEAGLNGYGVAVTQTDGAGGFFLCRVNAPVWMGVSSRQDWFRSISGAADLFFEIELTR